VSATSVLLLQAASEVVGGNRALAARLGIGETLLAKFMGNGCDLPDPLLLRTVDIILEQRHPRLAEALQRAENRGHGSDGTPQRGPA
jgi:hypothetical protein